MNDYKLLWNACDQLEVALNTGILGAVSFSCTENNIHDNEGWRKVIASKLDDIKLLNTKAIMLNATSSKGQIQVEDNLTLDEAKIRLNETTMNHCRWNNALKMKAICRIIYLINKNNDQEKKKLFDELLNKLFDLNFISNNLSCQEEQKTEELNKLIQEWKVTAEAWMKKKQIEAESVKSKQKEGLDTDGASDRITQLINKMETMRAIQGRLLGSCFSYDWSRDPNKLEEHLITSRRKPYKIEDFC